MKKSHVEKFAAEAFGNQKGSFEEAKKDFRDYYTSENQELQAAEKAYRNLIVLLLKNQSFPSPKVTSRIKDRNECIRKFDGKYRAQLEEVGTEYKIVDYVTDLIGVRVVCLYESDIENVSAVLKEHFVVEGETNKTQQLEDGGIEFGYKGLHLDLSLNRVRKKLPEYKNFSNLKFEVQIRTIVQDAWSEVDHKLKYKKQTPKELQRRIVRLAALFELADQEFEAIRDVSDELEREARENTNVADEDQTSFDLFAFIRVAAEFFPDFSFQGEALESLVYEINEHDNDMKLSKFRKLIADNITPVREYRDYHLTIGNGMSPYTEIRHSLYLSNKVLFDNIIFSGHRKNFDRWLSTGSVFPTK